MIRTDRIKTALLVALLFGAVVALFASEAKRHGLEAIRERGFLVVAVQPGPATYYDSAFGPTGFEFDLARDFANELGVQLRVLPVSSNDDALRRVAAGDADIAIGQPFSPGLDEKRLALSVPVQAMTPVIVCGPDTTEKPASIAELAPKTTFWVANGSRNNVLLENLRKHIPALSWSDVGSESDDDVLALINEDRQGCALMDPNAWAFFRHLYPSLVQAGNMPNPVLTGWIQARKGDGRLRQTANSFLARYLTGGTIVALREQHFAHLQSLTEADSHDFYQAVRARLPSYERVFRREAERNGLDWRLLAAVSYQESLWDPAAESPTGVQGLMQLTLDTAAQLGIEDRTDPASSIRGGARYLRQIIDALPSDIPDPDRTWMALAAYNAGIAHLADARMLTRTRGGNADNWPDVRENLALLKDPRWYTQTRYGYSRGATQAILYVRHVRRYYDLLVLAGNLRGSEHALLAMRGPRENGVN